MGEYMPMLDEVTDRDVVTGGAGVRLAVRTAGPADAPPSCCCTAGPSRPGCGPTSSPGQLADSFRLVAADLRGHGDSDVPAGRLRLGRCVGEDVSALLGLCGPARCAGRLVLRRPRDHGLPACARHVGLAGLRWSAPSPRSAGTTRAAGSVRRMRDVLPAALSDDPDIAGPALRSFATGMPDRWPPEPVGHRVGRGLDEGARVVRAALFARDVDSAAVLAAVDVPTLVLHGRQDTVVLPSAAEYAAGLIPGAPYAAGSPRGASAVRRAGRPVRHRPGRPPVSCFAPAGEDDMTPSDQRSCGSAARPAAAGRRAVRAHVTAGAARYRRCRRPERLRHADGAADGRRGVAVEIFTRATSSDLPPVVEVSPGVTGPACRGRAVRGPGQVGVTGAAVRVHRGRAAHGGVPRAGLLRRRALALLAVRPGRVAGQRALGRAVRAHGAHAGEGEERGARGRRHAGTADPGDRRAAGRRRVRPAGGQHRVEARTS